MANIGIRKFYFAQEMTAGGDAETQAQIDSAATLGTLLYFGDPENNGEPYEVGGARRCQITYTKADGTLYGDDAVAEQWDLILGAEIEIEWAPRATAADYIREGMKTEGQHRELLGVEWVDEPDGGPDHVYHLTTESTDRVGFGFVQTQIINGVKRYRAVKFHKVLFWVESEETQTKEERIEWGCPILKGKAEPVELINPETGERELQVRDYYTASTMAAAQAWLRGQFPEDLSTRAAALTITGIDLDPAFDGTKGVQVIEIGQPEAGNYNIVVTPPDGMVYRIEAEEAGGMSVSVRSSSGQARHYQLTVGELPAVGSSITLCLTLYDQISTGGVMQTLVPALTYHIILNRTQE